MVEIKPGRDGAGLRVGIVRARFNEAIGVRRARGVPRAPRRSSASPAPTSPSSAVPGALEVPLALQRLAATDGYDALIALGAVIRGETYHFEVVANESAPGVMQVQLDTGVPVANGILTTDTEAQAEAAPRPRGATARTSRSRWRTCSAPSIAATSRSAMKSARRRAREYALQGLYQWQLSGAPAADIRGAARRGRALRQGRRGVLRRSSSRHDRRGRGAQGRDRARCSTARSSRCRRSSAGSCCSRPGSSSTRPTSRSRW